MAAHAFARRHWRAFVGSRLALWIGVGIPVFAAVAIAVAGRVPGLAGGVLLGIAVIVVLLLALLTVTIGSCWLLAGFLPAPVIACEDSDAFDALSRTFGYAGAGLPRLLWVRLTFFGGVLLGAVWRLVCLGVVALLALACLRLGAGTHMMDRVQAILGAMGTPADAERLGLTDGHFIAATVCAFGLFAIASLWLSDLIVRSICGRTAAYLALRESIDRLPTSTLRTPPEARGHQTAAEAGFEEVGRLGDA